MVQTPTHSNRLTVLLPDHPEGWQATVRTLLQPQGVTTVTVRTGREALDLLESTTVHLAVLDANMPQLSGLQVLKLLREHKPTAKTPPAILLAQQLTNHLLHDALGMQVFSVLSKPVDLNILLDTMARVLKRYHESRWPDGAPPTTTNS
jgi:CheY-like chemotaxis protein